MEQVREELEERGLEDMLETAEDFAANSEDFVVDPDHLDFDVDEELREPKLNFMNSKDGSINNMPMSYFALSQLCEKLKIPSGYVNRCIEEHPDLARENVSEWLGDYESPMFVRTTYSRVKAMLSTKYSPYDSNLVLSDILQVMKDKPEYVVKGSYLSTDKLHVRMISDSPLDVHGEEEGDLFPGFIIDSSDVGKNSLSISAFIYKQVCTNGLMLPAKTLGQVYRKTHMGIATEDFRNNLISAVSAIPEILYDVTESIEETRATGMPFNPDLDTAVDYVHGYMDVSKQESCKIVDVVRSGRYENNRWGFINAVTEVAQDYSLDRRIELEKQAGRMLIAA